MSPRSWPSPSRTARRSSGHLGHCGFAVKTRSRLLIFDYFSRAGRRPDKPSLANGFINPEEIKDQDVTVFVSHSHGDHFDPVILSWRPVVKNITLRLRLERPEGRADDRPARAAGDGLARRNGDLHRQLRAERRSRSPPIWSRWTDLSIYHSGDYMGPVDRFKADMDYLLNKAGAIDLAFIGKFEQAERLKPRSSSPFTR